jgi:Mg2+ and Co2+ transporter CorA
MEEFIDVLRPAASEKSAARNQLLVPVLLASLTCIHLESLILKKDTELWYIQRETGLYANAPDQDPRILEQLDLGQIIRKLTSLSDTYSRALALVGTLYRILEPVTEIFEEQNQDTPAYETIRDAIQITSQTLRGSQQFIERVHSSTQSQIQTIYQLTNQGDNRLNLQMAKRTSEDSANMRVIAIVTLVFLPGTFTATLFSTTFFSFKQEGSPSVVSSWLWLYWVITVVLTCAVLLTWRNMTSGKWTRKRLYGDQGGKEDLEAAAAKKGK